MRASRTMHIGRRWSSLSDKEQRELAQRDPALARTRMNPDEQKAFDGESTDIAREGA